MALHDVRRSFAIPMLFFLCVLLPPVAVLFTGRMGSFLLSLLLTFLGWLPGVIHAFFVVSDYKSEQRLREITKDLKS